MLLSVACVFCCACEKGMKMLMGCGMRISVEKVVRAYIDKPPDCTEIIILVHTDFSNLIKAVLGTALGVISIA